MQCHKGHCCRQKLGFLSVSVRGSILSGLTLQGLGRGFTVARYQPALAIMGSISKGSLRRRRTGDLVQ